MSETRQERIKSTASVASIVDSMNEIAPPELAEAWDPVGLRIGRLNQPVHSVLIALDLTKAAFDLAQTMEQPMIIVHHPPIFDPLATLRTDHPVQSFLIRVAAKEISVFAAHTNLDSAPGGVADCLVSKVRSALDQPDSAAESPAVFTYGRSLALNVPKRLADVCSLVSRSLQSPGVWLNVDQDCDVERIAVFPGSFQEEAIMALQSEKIDTVICGEFKHSTGIAMQTAGINLIAVGHDVSERVVLQPLSDRLSRQFPDLPFAVYSGLDYNGSVFRDNRTAAGVSRKATREESPGSAGQGAG